ncbi:MAG: ABC transporter permease [Gammaproteobacteria bacterium]|nr:ABC transporter permease [Gammaproteobacteria bacterium]
MSQSAATSIQNIPLESLALAFIPVLIVIFILYKWSHNYKYSIYAITRMLGQLLLIGYFLSYIFKSDSSLLMLAIVFIMVIVSSSIALNNIKHKNKSLYLTTFLSILIPGSLTFALVTQGVLQLDPWFYPSYFIPLAGMIFANSMTSVSLAAERFESEFERNNNYHECRNISFKAAMIPQTNAMLAVGLVSLPGMMTGQILSGISPLIAARYQIMVMCMIYGSAGLAAAMYLYLNRKKYYSENDS